MEKKKVLIFGIGSNYLLEDMGKLSEDYEIVGYADYKYEFASKTYCYKPFYFPDEIKQADADYIIVLAKTRQDNDRKCNSLKALAVDEKQILPYFFWGGGWKENSFLESY